MRTGPIALAGILLFGLGLSGCLSGASETKDDTGVSRSHNTPITEHAHKVLNEAMAATGFDLGLKDCMEGGGVSLYNMQEGSPGPTKPFKRTSIADDTGYPMVASYGNPIPQGGATTGIWHTSVICKSYTFDGQEKGVLKWGWVGVRVLPPEWDDSGIKRQYFVADLSFSDYDIVEKVQDLTTAHASRMLDGKIEWLAPNVLHTILDDEDHGVFETHGKMKDYRAMEMGTTRFWMFVRVDGGMGHGHGDAIADDKPGCEGYRPISFDLVQTGSGKHYVVDGTAWLSHTRTDAHGSVPGAAGNVGGLLWTGFDRTMSLGPAPDLQFECTWLH